MTKESLDESRHEPSVSRRSILKFVAGAPLLASFGLLISPLARFLKPTMAPYGTFQESDRPKVSRPVEFSIYDFPEDWTCIPFELDLTCVVFSPRREHFRKIPGFAVRIAPDEIVAYSRVCPRQGCILNYVDPSMFNCGCAKTKTERCCCAGKVKNPVLVCPCDHSIFDLANGGCVIAGPAPRPLRQFELSRKGTYISVKSLESGGLILT